MGENGAGKSTLIKVLTGVYEHRRRHDHLDGEPVQASPGRCRPSRPGSAPSTRRSTSARTSRSRRTSSSAASRAGSAGSTGARCAAGRPSCWPGSTSTSTSTRAARRRTRSPCSRWSRSPGPSTSTPRCSSSTSRPPASTPARSRSCSGSCAQLRDDGHRDPVRLPLPRPGLRDRRPDHRAAQRPAGRRVRDRRRCRSCELVAKMIGKELAVLERPRASSRQRRRRRAPTSTAVPRGDRARPHRRDRAVQPRPSTRARSSAWPGCSAPAAPSWPGCCSAPTAPTAARSQIDGDARCTLRSPLTAIAERHRVLLGEPQHRGPRRRADRAREHHPRAAGRAAAGPGRLPRRRQDELVDKYIKALDIRPADPDALGPQPLAAATSRRCCWPAG